MITWHARVYNLRNTALPPRTAQNWASQEHAGALAFSRPRQPRHCTACSALVLLGHEPPLLHNRILGGLANVYPMLF
jgi:hypothetical protein